MQLAALLQLQRPAHERVHPEELRFQVVHQIVELQLITVCDDLLRAADAVDADQPWEAEMRLATATAALRVAHTALQTLSLLTLAAYHEIRSALGTSSAAESPGWQGTRRAASHLSNSFAKLLERQQRSLIDVYLHSDPADPAHRLAERMISFDASVSSWRHAHYTLAAQLIGASGAGTQGMPVDALARSSSMRLFPHVWQVRLSLTEGGGTVYATHAANGVQE